MDKLSETMWRSIAHSLAYHRDVCGGYGPHQGVLTPEGMDDQDYSGSKLEPEHLMAPWTPALLLNIYWVQRAWEHYDDWNRVGDFPDRVREWAGGNLGDPTATLGERVFEIAIETFKAAGLDETMREPFFEGVAPREWSWVTWVEGQRESYRKRVAWMSAEMKWVPFQIDINSPSLFLTVKRPDQWQVIVDAVRASDHVYKGWQDFLGEMRMASIEYIVQEIPGHHASTTRLKKDPDNPLGYGVRTDIPSFGYRREHRSETLFVAWAQANGMDLLNPEVW